MKEASPVPECRTGFQESADIAWEGALDELAQSRRDECCVGNASDSVAALVVISDLNIRQAVVKMQRWYRAPLAIAQERPVCESLGG